MLPQRRRPMTADVAKQDSRTHEADFFSFTALLAVILNRPYG
jgi:hypothetical protein